jgi:hypothetical protein
LLLKIIIYSISNSDIAEEAPEVAPDVSAPVAPSGAPISDPSGTSDAPEDPLFLALRL